MRNLTQQLSGLIVAGLGVAAIAAAGQGALALLGLAERALDASATASASPLAIAASVAELRPAPPRAAMLR